MNSTVFAQLMAKLCKPGFSELVLKVPMRYGDNDDLQHRLINSIVHGSQMAQICQSREAKEMIREVIQHLFEGATDCFAIQDEGARLIIGMVSHANAMARITTEVADRIYAEIHPLVNDSLPATQQKLNLLKKRLEAAWSEITNIVHTAQMERLIRKM